MRTEDRVVTPEMAAEWIRSNLPENRRVSKALVARFKRDMLAGNWRFTHQGIAFDRDGRLVDGQHRLLAIIESGVSAKMMVTVGVPQDAMVGIDTGKSRRDVDVLYIDGHPWVSKDHIAIARMVHGNGVPATNLSPQELLGIVQTHREAIEFSMLCRRTIHRGIGSAPVRAAIASAFYHENQDVLVGFMAVLESGITEDPARDSVVILLRDWLGKVPVSGMGQMARSEIYLKTQRAIKAYAGRERLAKIYRPSSTPYPVSVG